MPSFAEYLPIYIDLAMIKAGHFEVKVQASNFMRADCFQAVHVDRYNQLLAELRLAWSLIDALNRCGVVTGDLGLILQAADHLRHERAAL